MSNLDMTIGSTTKPFLEWCKEYEASPLQVRSLVSLGMPFEEALQAKAHRRIVLIQMNGQVKPLSVWCQQYGVSPSTVKKRINAGYTFEEAFESRKYQTHKIKTARHKQEQDYTIIKPFLEWCRDYLADPLHIRAAMSMGCSLEYALKNTDKGRINQLVMQVEGKTDTFLHFCSQYRKASNTIRRRVGMGLSLDQAFTLPPFKKGEIERLLERGKANESHLITQPLSGWCRDYHVSDKVVQQRLETGMDIEEALSTEQVEALEINGKRTTLNSFCARFGVDAVAVRKCVQSGMGILEAMDHVAFSQKASDKAPINGKALKAAREGAGLSQSQLAELVNRQGDFCFTKYTIHSLEHGKRLVTAEERRALEIVLGDSPLGCDVEMEGV